LRVHCMCQRVRCGLDIRLVLGFEGQTVVYEVASKIYWQPFHSWTPCVANRPLVWCQWSFFFLFFLIFVPDPLNFQSNPSICFFLYIWFLLFLLLFILYKIIFFQFHPSLIFFICQIWLSLFYYYLFYLR
jgi:hypothetical protein